jgi:hypothetical protein
VSSESRKVVVSEKYTQVLLRIISIFIFFIFLFVLFIYIYIYIF